MTPSSRSIRSSGAQAPPRTPAPTSSSSTSRSAALVDESGEASALAGELERDGLISTETVQQIACDATIAIGVDDDVGHTMYEGRARRTPSDAQRREVMRRDRHCRFPGCTNVTFTNVHHIVPWKPGGRTDLDNLALVVPAPPSPGALAGWEMTGNANEELTFTGPSGRVMTSRPSPLWTSGHGRPAIGLTLLRVSRAGGEVPPPLPCRSPCPTWPS